MTDSYHYKWKAKSFRDYLLGPWKGTPMKILQEWIGLEVLLTRRCIWKHRSMIDCFHRHVSYASVGVTLRVKLSIVSLYSCYQTITRFGLKVFWVVALESLLALAIRTHLLAYIKSLLNESAALFKKQMLMTASLFYGQPYWNTRYVITEKVRLQQ